MDWLWHNFGLISQKAPLDFQLGKMAELEAKSKLDLKSLSLSIPAKAFLASQLPFALKQPNVPRFEVFSDETLQNIIKVLLYIDYMEDAYFSSLEDYPVNPLTKFSGSEPI